MKMRAISLTVAVIAFALVVVRPSAAGEIYNNGPVNGTADAWTINFGFVVSDSFVVSGGNSTVTGLSFWTNLLPGDIVSSVEISLTSDEFGGTTYFDQVLAVTTNNCMTNQYGFNLCNESVTFAGPSLNNGTYWLNLQNAVVPSGDPVYWDENSGAGCTSPGCPSQASESSLGTIPSESFTLYGNVNGSTPEPGSVMLLGSGVIAVVGLLRRRLF